MILAHYSSPLASLLLLLLSPSLIGSADAGFGSLALGFSLRILLGSCIRVSPLRPEILRPCLPVMATLVFVARWSPPMGPQQSPRRVSLPLPAGNLPAAWLPRQRSGGSGGRKWIGTETGRGGSKVAAFFERRGYSLARTSTRATRILHSTDQRRSAYLLIDKSRVVGARNARVLLSLT
jgi:hypothetical protein